jgi:hypothetical protein
MFANKIGKLAENIFVALGAIGLCTISIILLTLLWPFIQVCLDTATQPTRVHFRDNGIHLTGSINGRSVADVIFILLFQQGDAGDRGVVTIRLDSKGGDVHAAKLMNRALSLDRLIRGTRYRMTVGSHNICASACTMIFAHGDMRVASRDSLFMFHGPVHAGQYVEMSLWNDIILTVRRAVPLMINPIYKADPALARQLQLDEIYDSPNNTAYFSGQQLHAAFPAFLELSKDKRIEPACLSEERADAAVKKCEANPHQNPAGLAPYCRDIFEPSERQCDR